MERSPHNTESLPDELMENMNAKRLRTVYRYTRNLMYSYMCPCCSEVMEYDREEYEYLKGRVKHIKSILDRKEHIE